MPPICLILLQYGFTKARKGPEIDTYSHPSFLRDSPHLLHCLRKLGGGGGPPRQSSTISVDHRAVSPSTTGNSMGSHDGAYDAPPRHDMPKAMAAAPRKVSGADDEAPRGCLDLLALAMEYAG
jgi:hypothetical protein